MPGSLMKRGPGRPKKNRLPEWLKSFEPQSQPEGHEYTEAFVASNLKDYLRILDSIARDTDQDAKERRMAIAELLERGLGKAGVPEKGTPMNELKEVLLAFAEVNRTAAERERAGLDEGGPGRPRLPGGPHVAAGDGGPEDGQEAAVYDAETA